MYKIIVFCLLSNLIFAQNELAKDLLKNLNYQTQLYKNITIEFEFILENKAQNIYEKENGIFILENNKFRIELNNQIIINNTETQWIYIKDINELQIMNHDPEENSISPKKIFTISEEDYKYSYIGKKTENNKNLEVIDLFSKESTDFMKVQLEINSNKNQLHKIIMFDKNNGTYTYIIKNFITNQEIKPFNFNTSNYSNIEIIDLR